MHPIFPRGEGAVAPVLGEVSLGAAGKVVAPCGFEGGAGLFEGFGRVAAALVRPVIETDRPAPLVDVGRYAGALGDRADAGIAVIDVPAFLVDVGF